jgi:hypothetical protein
MYLYEFPYNVATINNIRKTTLTTYKPIQCDVKKSMTMVLFFSTAYFDDQGFYNNIFSWTMPLVSSKGDL